MKNILKYFGLALFVISINACKKVGQELEVTPINKVKVGEAYALGAATKIQLWADAELTTGYNQFYIIALDSSSNQPKTNVVFKIKPMMTMTGGMTMKHSCPFEEANASVTNDNLTPAVAVFSMPTSDSGFWQMEVTVNNKTAAVPIKVTEPPQSKLVFTQSLADNSNYIVALVPIARYKIGQNDFELKINKKIDGMTYVPANDLSIEITPEMPDMGHGSPNNADPVFVKDGHYKGKVNFTMTGYWKVNLKIKDANNALVSEDTFFKITF